MSKLIISVSGVRGIVGDSLTPQSACELALAYAALLGQGRGPNLGGVIIVGRDSRPSGRMIEQALCAGLLASGLAVRSLGIVATPTTALAVRDLGCAGGVMITASHNPGEYNGLKFMQPDGQCLSAAAMMQLAHLYRSKIFKLTDHHAEFDVSHDEQATTRHVERVLGCVDRSKIRRLRLAVLLDSVNGAGGLGGRLLLESLGCRAEFLYPEPTGRFPRPPEPTPEHLHQTAARVAAAQVAVGFVQDPDADRLALIDEAGRYIGEEYTLVLAAKSVLEHRPGPLATNLSTSRMIDDVAAAAGVTVFRTPVGEANVAAAVGEHHCVLGGEGNGGVIDPRVVPVRDSLTGIALVADLLARTGLPLSKLVADLPRYHMVKKKLPLPADGVASMLKRVAAAGGDGKINDSDGVRIDWPAGWVHVRASNTEPACRVIAEAVDEVETNKILQRVAEAIGPAGR